MSVLRFHLDEDTESRALVRALRLRGVDLTTTAEADLKTVCDAAQLTWAAKEGRVLLSQNASDFCLLHRKLLASGRSHLGNRNYRAAKMVCWRAYAAPPAVVGRSWARSDAEPLGIFKPLVISGVDLQLLL